MPGPTRIKCPCCAAELEIEAGGASVRAVGVKGKPAAEVDLAAEVARLREAPKEREQAFQRSMDAERSRAKTLDDRFEQLLKKAKDGPVKPWNRDIDL